LDDNPATIQVHQTVKLVSADPLRRYEPVNRLEQPVYLLLN